MDVNRHGPLFSAIAQDLSDMDTCPWLPDCLMATDDDDTKNHAGKDRLTGILPHKWIIV
jgi:hypothetical protein